MHEPRDPSLKVVSQVFALLLFFLVHCLDYHVLLSVVPIWGEKKFTPRLLKEIKTKKPTKKKREKKRFYVFFFFFVLFCFL
jgi:hypothetical protein